MRPRVFGLGFLALEFLNLGFWDQGLELPVLESIIFRPQIEFNCDHHHVLSALLPEGKACGDCADAFLKNWVPLQVDMKCSCLCTNSSCTR